MEDFSSTKVVEKNSGISFQSFQGNRSKDLTTSLRFHPTEIGQLGKERREV